MIKIIFYTLFFLSLNVFAASEQYFYGFDCAEAKLPVSKESLDSIYKELNLQKDNGIGLMSTLKASGFYPVYINQKLHIVSPQKAYSQNTDANKAFTFPFACSFFSIYEFDLGVEKFALEVDKNFQLPANYKLLSPL